MPTFTSDCGGRKVFTRASQYVFEFSTSLTIQRCRSHRYYVRPQRMGGVEDDAKPLTFSNVNGKLPVDSWLLKGSFRDTVCPQDLHTHIHFQQRLSILKVTSTNI